MSRAEQRKHTCVSGEKVKSSVPGKASRTHAAHAAGLQRDQVKPLRYEPHAVSRKRRPPPSPGGEGGSGGEGGDSGGGDIGGIGGSAGGEGDVGGGGELGGGACGGGLGSTVRYVLYQELRDRAAPGSHARHVCK